MAPFLSIYVQQKVSFLYKWIYPIYILPLKTWFSTRRAKKKRNPSWKKPLNSEDKWIDTVTLCGATLDDRFLVSEIVVSRKWVWTNRKDMPRRRRRRRSVERPNTTGRRAGSWHFEVVFGSGCVRLTGCWWWVFSSWPHSVLLPGEWITKGDF